MRSWRIVLAICLPVLIQEGRVAAAVRYQVTGLGGISGGASPVPLAMNNSGWIVGQDAVDSVRSTWHAVLWRGSAVTDIHGTVARHSIALDVNDSGWVVGGTYDLDTNWREGFLYHSGMFTELPDLQDAAGINEIGQVAGTSALPDSKAVVWSEGTLTQLGTLGGSWSVAEDINNRGDVVGRSETSTGAIHAFFSRDSSMTDLGALYGHWSEATAVNDLGQVVGMSSVDQGTVHAFLWADGTMRSLGAVQGSSYAHDINNWGQVVGDTGSADLSLHAFLWTEGAMFDLNDLVGPGSGWILKAARAINDAGQIAGFGYLDGHERAFLLTPVLEPTTMCFMGLAIVVVFGTHPTHRVHRSVRTQSGQQRPSGQECDN